MEYWNDEEGCWEEEHIDYGSKNLGTPRDVHIMNSGESKVLRKIMAKTGLNEVEVRAIKKYRVELSKAQKEGEKSKRSDLQKCKDGLMKEATKDLGLAKEHPLVKALYKEKVKKYVGDGWRPNRFPYDQLINY
tara:strand:+ start:989 stop:1387 length:399 start_codon:yes stop_codon:yes gene_type:complete